MICVTLMLLSCLSLIVIVPSLFCAPGCQAPHCSADDLDISQSLLKALEGERDSLPWPSLHINMDKVRPLAAVRPCALAFTLLLLLLLSGRREATV